MKVKSLPTKPNISKFVSKLWAVFCTVCCLQLTLSFIHRDEDHPFLLKPDSQPILEQIVAKFRPQLSSPVKSSLLPVTLAQENEIREKLSSTNTQRSVILTTPRTIASIWEKDLLADPLETSLIVNALRTIGINTLIKKGTKVQVKLDSDGTPLTLSFRVDTTHKAVITRGVGNQFAALIQEDAPFLEERIVSGTITSSFIEAAIKAELPLQLVDDYVDLFGERVDFRKDIQTGDAFSIILKQKKYSDGTWGEPVEILAASLMNEGHLKAVVKWKDRAGQIRSYDETGQPIGSYFLKYPLQFTRISSVFTDDRLHPVLGIRRPHNGVDFAAPTGTPVRVVGDGIVEKSGQFGDCGNMIRIAHGKQWATAYLHLSKIDPQIKAGVHVKRGQIIGLVGMTGLASGPHLHFGLFDNGKYVDPIKTKLPSVLDENDIAPAKIIQASLSTMKEKLDAIVLAFNTSSKIRRG